jgi:apolipoprotein N-acyltransferase
LKNNLAKFAGYALAGFVIGYLLFLSFPPYQFLIGSLLSLVISYWVLRSKVSWILKSLSMAIAQFTFFYFFHARSEWYLEIATRNEPINYQLFKWLAILQYSGGAILVFVFGAFLLSLKQVKETWKIPLIITGTFTLQWFVTTANSDNSFVIPFLASNFFKGSFIPFAAYLFILQGLFFYSLDFAFTKKFKKCALSLAALILFIVGNNLFCQQMGSLPDNLVVLSGESFNLDGKNATDIENHFIKFKQPYTGKLTYVWPEALMTFKRPNQTQQSIVEDIFKRHFPGTHFYGAYTVKENVPASSTNKYFSLNTESGEKHEINKAFPVPFQEASDYFWFIPQSKIGLSFNVKTTKKFAFLNLNEKRVGIFLCNEVGELREVLGQYPNEAELILIPSNTPAQNTEYYEEVLDFYSRVLAKIKRTPLIKVSSHGRIYVIENDQISSLQKSAYLSGSPK